MTPEVACPKHPDVTTRETCARCGAFVCNQCSSVIQSKQYCETCAARADVNWLETYRLSRLGKREGGLWGALLGALALFPLGAAFLTSRPDAAVRALGVLTLFQGLCSLLFFFRVRPTRFSPALLAVLWALLGFTGSWAAFVPAVFNVFLQLIVSTDPGIKFFFRLPMSDAVVLTHWKRFGDNPMAVTAAQLTVLGIFIPFGAPVAVVYSCIALSRVNRSANPPVGKLWSALGSLVISLLICVGWAVAMFQ